MSQTTTAELVSGSVELASLPEVLYRVNKMARGAHYSAADIGRIISQDPALSARLLHIVNSPFYGFPSSIDTISRAITIIGSRELCNILCAATVTRHFQGLPETQVNMQQFWQHSLYSAVVARELALQLRENDSEHFFLSGLLHDIGSLVLYQRVPEREKQAIDQARRNRQAIFIAEREQLGTDHAEVGAALLHKWRLPQSLIEAVACHHSPLDARNYPRETWIAHAADLIANHSPAGCSPNPVTTDLNTLVQPGLSLINQAQLEQVMANSEHKFEQACQAYLQPA